MPKCYCCCAVGITLPHRPSFPLAERTTSCSTPQPQHQRRNSSAALLRRALQPQPRFGVMARDPRTRIRGEELPSLVTCPREITAVCLDIPDLRSLRAVLGGQEFRVPMDLSTAPCGGSHVRRRSPGTILPATAADEVSVLYVLWHRSVVRAEAEMQLTT